MAWCCLVAYGLTANEIDYWTDFAKVESTWVLRLEAEPWKFNET